MSDRSLRCPSCNRHLARVSKLNGGEIEIPCPRCNGRATFLFESDGKLLGKRYEGRDVAKQRVRIPVKDGQPLAARV